MLKKITILGVVLVVIGIIGGAFTFKSLLHTDTDSEEKIIDEDFKAMEINAEDITVNVTSTNDSDTTIKMTTQTSEYDLRTDVSADTLQVNVKHEQKKLFSFDIFDFTPKLHISIPEKEYEKMDLKTDNGIIDVTNITGDEIKATSVNGLIKMKHITSKDVMTKTENGLIKLEDVEGDIVSKTNNGKIDLLTKDLDRMVDLDTTNGAIKVITEKEPTNATINASVANGKLSIFGKNKAHSVIGEGENQITLTTENGMITVK